jgi:hypothetical protein
MTARKHVAVLKSFDQYTVPPGGKLRAVLSESGFQRLQDHKKGFMVELEATEHDDGRLSLYGKEPKELSREDAAKLFTLDGKLVDGFLELAKKMPAAKDRADRSALQTRAG